MPANLNALVRYKTINSCLYGGFRKYDIHELIEACSNALSESRGRDLKISERTVRDDIRVMRSDILGFSAPIVQKDGLYFYSDPQYSILSVGITDPGILDVVIKSLLRISHDVNHPELEIILKKLKKFSPESFKPVQVLQEARVYNKVRPEFKLDTMFDKPVPSPEKVKRENHESDIRFSMAEPVYPSWGEVFSSLFAGGKKSSKSK